MKAVREFKDGIFQNRWGNALVIEGGALWNKFLPVLNGLKGAGIHHGCYMHVIADCGVKSGCRPNPMLGNYQRDYLGVSPSSGIADLEVKAIVFVHRSLKTPNQFGSCGAGEQDI